MKGLWGSFKDEEDSVVQKRKEASPNLMKFWKHSFHAVWAVLAFATEHVVMASVDNGSLLPSSRTSQSSRIKSTAKAYEKNYYREESQNLQHRILQNEPTEAATTTLPNTNIVGTIPRGGAWWNAGVNPFGYKITELGEEFLRIDGSVESDVGRFLASLKTQRKRVKAIKEQWLEILRVAKTGQSMRIYRKLDELIQFCLKAGFID